MAAIGITACLEDLGVEQEAHPGRVRLLALVEMDEACDLVGIVELELRARRLECTEDGACTLPPRPDTVTGDPYSCPAANTEELLGVDVARPGRYAVDLVFHYVSDLPTTQCFTDPGGWFVEVDEDDLDAGQTRRLRAQDEPCREHEQ